MKLRILHATHYAYSAPLTYAIQSLYLTPTSGPHQDVMDWHLQAPGTLFAQTDGYGNSSHTFSLSRPLVKGTVRAQGVVATRPVADFIDDERWVSPWLYLRHSALARPDAAMREFAHARFKGTTDTDDLLELAAQVGYKVAYHKGRTDSTTTAAQAFELGSGVCQDQAQVFVALCRLRDIPARYVSGYFYADDAPELASHAWADVCVDISARRWISIDVTHACLMDERHVRLAVGPDYHACAPVRGVRTGGGQEHMEVHVEIRPL